MGTLLIVLAVIAVIAVGVRLVLRLTAIEEIRLDDVPQGDRRIVQAEMLVDRLEFERDIADELNYGDAVLANLDAQVATARADAQRVRDEVAAEASQPEPVTDPVTNPLPQPGRVRLRPSPVAAVRSTRQTRNKQ